MLNKWSTLYHGLSESDRVSRLGTYGCDTAYKAGAEFLKGLAVEDWGCGYGAYKAHHQGKYLGIDGTKGEWTDVQDDLRTRKTSTPAIFMRGVLEHNHDWKDVLDAAVASFTKRMFIAVFTPLLPETTVLQQNACMLGVPDIGFKVSDLTDRLIGCTFELERDVPTNTQHRKEHFLRITKNKTR